MSYVCRTCTAGLSSMELILVGGFLMGAWSAISPAIGQSYTSKVTDNDEIAIGHLQFRATIYRLGLPNMLVKLKIAQKILKYQKMGAFM